MTKFRPVRETTPTTTRRTPTLEERVAMGRAFVDAQRVRKDYKPGWFEEVETELHERMLEIERDLTAEILAAQDVDAPAIEIEASCTSGRWSGTTTVETLDVLTSDGQWVHVENGAVR